MQRDSEIFYFEHKSLKELITDIESSSPTSNLMNIAVYERRGLSNCYVILSATEIVDNILLKHGAVKATNDDQYKRALKIDQSDLSTLCFGTDKLIPFLP